MKVQAMVSKRAGWLVPVLGLGVAVLGGVFAWSAAESQYVHLGADGRLVYVPFANGDTIPDFSNAGYGGGGVALPNVPVALTVAPVDGDDGASIQAAIDAVSALPPDADGFRGAVLLQAGTYEVAGGVSIRASGVVLRGEGDGPGGTLIKAVGTARRTVITVNGNSSPGFGRTEVAGTKQLIVDAYVPVGAHSFTVADASGFQVGDAVLAVRTPNQEWIDASGTDACSTVGTAYDTSDVDNSTCISESHWKPADRIMRYERTITGINGNLVTFDAPMVEAFQAEFGGGYLVKYVFPGRIEKVGVESLRSESAFASDTDENHAVRMLSITNVQNAWVRNVTSVYFEQGTVSVGGGAKYVTVQDSASLDHKSLITGGRRYPFNVDDAAFVLVMRCYAKTGRHDYVTGSNTPGPNVFLDSKAEQSHSELGPHHRWATGTLFDLIRHESVSRTQIIGAYNRGNSGSGHGWSGAFQVFWNCVGDTHRVANPPNARNWSIGCQTRKKEGDGTFDSYGTPVFPSSLYLQQLEDRLGEAALANIGYSAMPPLPAPPTPIPSPSPTPTPSAMPPGLGPNLAKNKPSTASTVWNFPSTSFNAAKAFDGSDSSRWSASRDSATDQWLAVDLLTDTPYNCVVMKEINFKRVQEHVLQSSDDGVHFTDIQGTAGTTIGALKATCFETVTSRHFRLFMFRSVSAGALKEPTVNEVAVHFQDRAPVLTVPDAITAEATGPDGAVVTFSASASDEVDGDLEVDLSPQSGSTFPLGTTTVTAMATDSAGNKATATFDVLVEDTTPPTMELPESVEEEATSPAGAVVSFELTATDLVSGNVPIVFSHAPGSLFPLGTTVVTATATDAAENTATATFAVVVRDSTAPLIESLAASPSSIWPPNHRMVDVLLSALVKDAADPAPTTRIVEVSSNEPVDGTGDGDTAPDWAVTGDLTLQVRAERAGHGGGRLYTITVESRDAAGNASRRTAGVTVSHNR